MEKPVLILGAGINGAAIARELLVQRVPVCIVDTADLAGGTTAYSSRLIHGGLRYLEYGELGLVRESLQERGRLRRLAPHLVQPLRLYIPIQQRGGGMVQGAARLCGLARPGSPRAPRGLWLVRIGLTLYDTLAGRSNFGKHAVHRVGQPGVPQVDRGRFRWLCSYMDAQLALPERFVVALLHDCCRIAKELDCEFRLLTYCRARRTGAVIELQRRTGTLERLEPAAIINATGAWVDRTLAQLDVDSKRLIGGTKGSHLLTFQPQLRDRLQGQGVYAEADDGRPVFFLPFMGGTLIGTTDIVFEGAPEEAVASEAEIEYLLNATNGLFPHLALHRDDIHLHYCGVRPLPYVDAVASPAAVTRKHQLHWHGDMEPMMLSVIGGKLTTCRSLGEEAARAVLARFKLPAEGDSRHRPLPGTPPGSLNEPTFEPPLKELAAAADVSRAQITAMWTLCGSECVEILHRGAGPEPLKNLTGTSLPVGFVRGLIRSEWVQHLADVVERRLMLLYDPSLGLPTLRHLVDLMVQEGVLNEDQATKELEACRAAPRSTARAYRLGAEGRERRAVSGEL